MSDALNVVQEGIPSGDFTTPNHLGRVITVPWREGDQVATVIGEGVRGRLVLPKKGKVTPTNSGFIPSEQYITLYFPDTDEVVEVPVAWMPPKGSA